jgi:parallel beta-helix repeat protein
MRKTILALVPLLFLSAFSARADTYISACSVLNTTGETYYLTQDIIDASGPLPFTCMDIQATDIVLDCQGHTIDGIDAINSIGISAGWVSPTDTNITIRNCVLRDWERGIEMDYANNNKIESSTFYSNTYGVYLSNGNDNRVEGNTFTYNSYGLRLLAETSDIVYNNYFDSNTYGIYTTAGIGNVINYNKIESIQKGMYISYDQNDLIYNNYFASPTNVEFGTVYANYWNTTRQAGTRVYSIGNEIGGNYWSSPDRNGYSDNCVDSDKDGFCDSPYVLATDNVDYLPYSDELGGQVESCMNINTPGYYELTGNITVNDPSITYCILINTSNVVLNGKGYWVESTFHNWASDKGTGIRVYTPPGVPMFNKTAGIGNITVENLNVKGWNVGIYTTSDYVNLNNILLYNNSLAVYITGTKVKAEKTKVYGNNIGVYILYGKDVELYDNYIHQQTASVYIQNSSSVVLDKNRIFWSGYGIIFDNTEALVYNNLFVGNDYSDVYYYGDTSKIRLNTSLLYTPNVLGGAYVCGNYWDKFDKCVDSDANGVCENSYTPLSPLTDYCPLTYIFTLSSCTNITMSGTYVLDRDIEVPLDKDAQGHYIYSSCFFVSNLEYFTLDCKGHSIIGIGRENPNLGVSLIPIFDTKNVKISNCKFTDSARSVFADNVGKLEFSNNQVYADKQTLSSGLAVECVNCNNTVIMGNKIYGTNTTDFKCLTFFGSRGQISDNYIQNCYTGIYIGTSYNSFTIFNNYFANNIKDFDRDGASCSQVWNIPRTKEVNIIGGNEKGGNYWDKYACVNLDGDSFCDDAYIIDTCNKDELPLATAFTYYTGLPAVLQPFVSPYTIFMSLIGGLGVGLDFASKAGGKVLITVLVVGIMGAIFSSLFPAWTLLVFIVLAGFIIAYLIIRFIGGAV